MPSKIDVQKKCPLPVALLVLPSGKRRRTLLSYIESRNLTAAAVDTCRAARECTNANPTIDIVITQVSLKDGNWCDVLACAVNREVEARVVVSSTVADERFWSEALWRGVYDVLLEPSLRLLRSETDRGWRTAGRGTESWAHRSFERESIDWQRRRPG